MINKKLSFVLLAVVFFIVASAAALASNKKLTLTSSSPVAKEEYWKARKALESMNFQQIPGHVQKALKADPDFAFGLMLLSATQPPAAALKTLDRALDAAKTATEGERRYIQATKTYRTGDSPGAIQQLEALLQDYPADRGTWMFLGQLYQSQNEPAKAEKAYRKAMKLDDSTLRVYNFLSQVKSAQGDPDGAKAVLESAMQIPGAEANVNTALGTLELLRDHYASARSYYKKVADAADADASPFLPFFGQAWTYIYEGKVEPALATINEYLQRYNRNGAAQGFPPVWIWNHMGRINMEFGRVQEAIRCYEVGYKTVPPAPEAAIDSVNKIVWKGRSLYGKARGLARLGKRDEAWAIVNKIKGMIDEGGKQGAQYLQAHHYMAGYLYSESGEYAKAIEHLEQADPNDPFHQLLLARAYEKSGDSNRAKETYERITKMTVNNIERALSYPEARRKLALLSASN